MGCPICGWDHDVVISAEGCPNEPQHGEFEIMPANNLAQDSKSASDEERLEVG